MQLHTLDWIIAFFAVAVCFIPALFFGKRSGKNTAEFFASGRSVPWWLAGLSMVATTFSSDTPNLVANFVRTQGVAGNWQWWAFTLTGVATVFWLVQTIFAFTGARSILFGLIALALTTLFAVACGFAVTAFREVRQNPPPRGHEVLPPGYKIPYSHYHPDPPEVRLAAELEQRRQRLAVQQKELEMLEEKLRKKLDEKRPEES